MVHAVVVCFSIAVSVALLRVWVCCIVAELPNVFGFLLFSKIYLFLRFVLHRLSDVIYRFFYQFTLKLSFFIVLFFRFFYKNDACCVTFICVEVFVFGR